jgi:flagellar biogenesis protein FliO
MFSTRNFRKIPVTVAFALAIALSMASAPRWAISGVPSALNIRQVQVADAERVDLLLDGRIQEGQIRTEYINDIIQLSLSDTNVYPAKISSVSGRDITKVFVYQYAPRLVRVRLTVKGRAEDYQGRVSVRPSGKVLSISVGSGVASDQITSKSAQVRKKSEAPAAQAATTDAEERALLDRILSSEKPAPKAEARNSGSARTSRGRTPIVAGPTSLVSPARAVASFMGILLLMAAAFFGLRRLSAAAGKGQNGALSRLITRTLGKPARMIEVVATHYLGPKKSIHVVRVAGRTLVLGVSDGSINLITEFQGEAPVDAAAAAVIQPQARTETAPAAGDFLAALGEELAQESGGKPGMGAGAQAAGPALPVMPTGSAAPTSRERARDRIRSRLEGMKQL